MDWTDRDYSRVVEGAIIQHSLSMRYAVVAGEPDADKVPVRQANKHLQYWKLKDLTWRRKDGAVVDFRSTEDFKGRKRG